MLLFLAALYAVGVLATAVNMTLLDTRRHAAVLLLLLLATTVASHPISLSLSTRKLSAVLFSLPVLRDLCLLQILEAFGIVVWVVDALGARQQGRKPRWWRRLAWMVPSPVFLAMNCVWLTLLFYRYDGVSFGWITTFFAAAAAFGVTGIAVALWRFLPDWYLRAETRALLALVQIVPAMFVPLLAAREAVTGTYLSVDLPATTLTVLLAALAAVVGFLVSRFIDPERSRGVWRFFTKLSI